MIVEFNTNIFRNRHPSFTVDKVSDDALEYQFQLACQIVPNNDGSFVPFDPDQGVYDRDMVLDVLTCHLTTLAIRDPEQAGNIASASEGSVSVSYQVPQMNDAYFSMTPCGQTFLQMMKRYRQYGGVQVHPSNFHPYG